MNPMPYPLVFVCPPEEGHDLRPCAVSIWRECRRTGAAGDPFRNRPVYGLCIISIGAHICKRARRGGIGGLLPSPEEGYDLGAAAGDIWAEGCCAGAAGNPLLNSPQDCLVVVGIGGYIRKGVLGNPRLRGTCRPPQEGHGLGPRANCIGAESCCTGTAGDPLLHRPQHSVVIIGVSGYIRERIGGGRLFRGLLRRQAAGGRRDGDAGGGDGDGLRGAGLAGKCVGTSDNGRHAVVRNHSDSLLVSRDLEPRVSSGDCEGVPVLAQIVGGDGDGLPGGRGAGGGDARLREGHGLRPGDRHLGVGIALQQGEVAGTAVQGQNRQDLAVLGAHGEDPSVGAARPVGGDVRHRQGAGGAHAVLNDRVPTAGGLHPERTGVDAQKSHGNLRALTAGGLPPVVLQIESVVQVGGQGVLDEGRFAPAHRVVKGLAGEVALNTQLVEDHGLVGIPDVDQIVTGAVPGVARGHHGVTGRIIAAVVQPQAHHQIVGLIQPTDKGAQVDALVGRVVIVPVVADGIHRLGQIVEIDEVVDRFAVHWVWQIPQTLGTWDKGGSAQFLQVGEAVDGGHAVTGTTPFLEGLVVQCPVDSGASAGKDPQIGFADLVVLLEVGAGVAKPEGVPNVLKGRIPHRVEGQILGDGDGGVCLVHRVEGDPHLPVTIRPAHLGVALIGSHRLYAREAGGAIGNGDRGSRRNVQTVPVEVDHAIIQRLPHRI